MLVCKESIDYTETAFNFMPRRGKQEDKILTFH
jgi:hypothetical protein